MPKTKEELEAAYKQAMTTLDEIMKSVEEGTADDALEALKKAQADLETVKTEFDAFLAKSKEEEEEDEDEKDEDEKEEETEKSEDEDFDEILRKALGEGYSEEDAEELVKASEAFEGLTASVTALQKSVGESVGGLAKSVGAQTELVLAMAKSLGVISKRLEKLEAAPVAGARSKVGLGGEEQEKKGRKIEKSRPEVQELLVKAVEDQKIPSAWLSKFGANGGRVEILADWPEDILKAANIL